MQRSRLKNDLKTATWRRVLLRYASCVLVPWGGYYLLAAADFARIVAVSYEGELCHWERALLGGACAPEHFAAWMRIAPLGDLLIGVYLSFYVALLLTPAWLLHNEKGATFVRLRRLWAVAGLLGYTLYFLLPAKSPYYVLNLFRQPDYAFSQRLVYQALNNGVAFPYDAFPSMHVTFSLLGVLVLHAVVDRHARPWLWSWLTLLLIAAMAVGAHWGLDVVAGIVLALAVYGIDVVQRDRHERKKQQEVPRCASC